jgi:hypothetical protein
MTMTIRETFDKSTRASMRVAVEEGTFTGTRNGILPNSAGDVPPIGSKVSVDYVQTIRFRDGKQAAFDLMYDRLQLLEQLGLSPVSA